MAELKFRDINPNVIAALDDIVEKENYASRNQLVNEILTHYVTCKSDFFIKTLPEVTASLCRAEIKNCSDAADETINSIIPIFIKILNDLDDIKSIFYGELPNK